LGFKQCPIVTKGPKVCQENIPHTITPPPPACTGVTRHDGSMFSFCSLSCVQMGALVMHDCTRKRAVKMAFCWIAVCDCNLKCTIIVVKHS